MNTKSQQIEFEITPKDAKSNYSYLSNLKDDTRSEPASINVIFSHQSVIVIFICIVMSLIASFTLGVEKGKLIARNGAAVEKAPESAAAVAAALSPEKIQTAENVKPLVPEQPIQPIAVTQETIKTPTGGFTIQVASVTAETSAKGLADSLIKKGIAAFTKRSGKYTIVLAGNFAKKEDAQVRLRELKKTYTDCFIRKI
jgi:septal ring-binding cell division protein DamX